MIERVGDILKEMRDADGVDSSGRFTQKHVLDWADRIEAAHSFDIKCEAEFFMKVLHKNKELRDENAKLKEELKAVTAAKKEVN